jgi:hypothetical protein
VLEYQLNKYQLNNVAWYMRGGALNIVLMKTDNSFVFVYEVYVFVRSIYVISIDRPDADVPQSISVPPDFLRPSRIQKQC